MLAAVGEWVLIVCGVYVFFSLLGWLWRDHRWVLYCFAAVAVIGILRSWKPAQEQIQIPQTPPETAAPVVAVTQDSQYRPYWNKGVCQNLAQDVCIVALFIDDSEKAWADYTVDWFLENKIKPGIGFIETEAAEYGLDIRMEYLTYTGVKTRENILSYDVQQGANVYDVLREAAASLGFSTSQEMLAYHREYTGRQQIVYMLCANKNGRPYAYGSGSSSPDDIECCVVFCNSASSAASSYNTIFHEILHLFGAADYYAEGNERVNREKMAQRLCPNDIMLDSYNAGLRDVGRYTAYCIGWLDTMPEEYNRPEWWS